MQDISDQVETVAPTVQMEAPKVDTRALTYEERQELNGLSKTFLGASSRWKKLEERGVLRGNPNGEGSMYVRVSPRELLVQLQFMKLRYESEQYVRKAATEASGTIA